MPNAAYPGRVLVLGAGSVSQCTVPLLISDLVVSPAQITVMDYVDNRDRFAEPLAAGVTYVSDEVTRENLGTLLGSYLGAGDLLVDLAWNIDCNEIVSWCHDNGVLYVNTSIEEWDPYGDAQSRHPLERTLFHRHMRLRELRDAWQGSGPTAVVEHGANPGLVSHWTKQALVEIGTKAVADGLAADGVADALATEDYAALAEALNVRVIHIAERDTQLSDQPKRVNEFVNTWSIAGFHEEGVAPAELGWGTHEKQLPDRAYVHTTGPANQICIAQPGATTWVRSWVPDFETIGMVIRHGEAFTITEHLTVRNADGTDRYRPTVHYAYCPTDAAIASLNELQARNWVLQDQLRIMNDEITTGEDRLGVLLMGHPYQAWWTGSLLSIGDARRLVPHQNATTLQVAASVLGACTWMVRNPDRGVCVPDDLPWREVLAVANPYLGQLHSAPADWDPVRNRQDPFEGWNGRAYDDSDPWQFGNFLV